MAHQVTRTGTQTANEGRGGHTITEVYEVLLDAPSTIGHLHAKRAAGVPWHGQRHPNAPALTVVDKNCTALSAAGGLYEVTVTYGSVNLNFADEEEVAPEARPWRIQTSWVSSTEAVDMDADGKPLVNSSDEPFDPPDCEEILDKLYTITGTLKDTAANRAMLDRLNNTVNTDTVYGYGPGRGRMRTSAERMRQGRKRWLEVTVEILFRTVPKGVPEKYAWHRRKLDQGYRTKTITGNEAVYTAITGDDGQAVSQPVLLDGKGGRLAAGAKPVWLYFPRFSTARFADLGLPPED